MFESPFDHRWAREKAFAKTVTDRQTVERKQRPLHSHLVIRRKLGWPGVRMRSKKPASFPKPESFNPIGPDWSNPFSNPICESQLVVHRVRAVGVRGMND